MFAMLHLCSTVFHACRATDSIYYRKQMHGISMKALLSLRRRHERTTGQAIARQYAHYRWRIMQTTHRRTYARTHARGQQLAATPWVKCQLDVTLFGRVFPPADSPAGPYKLSSVVSCSTRTNVRACVKRLKCSSKKRSQRTRAW